MRLKVITPLGEAGYLDQNLWRASGNPNELLSMDSNPNVSGFIPFPLIDS
jgi:hypothetical protein